MSTHDIVVMEAASSEVIHVEPPPPALPSSSSSFTRGYLRQIPRWWATFTVIVLGLTLAISLPLLLTDRKFQSGRNGIPDPNGATGSNNGDAVTSFVEQDSVEDLSASSMIAPSKASKGKPKATKQGSSPSPAEIAFDQGDDALNERAGPGSSSSTSKSSKKSSPKSSTATTTSTSREGDLAFDEVVDAMISNSKSRSKSSSPKVSRKSSPTTPPFYSEPRTPATSPDGDLAFDQGDTMVEAGMTSEKKSSSGGSSRKASPKSSTSGLPSSTSPRLPASSPGDGLAFDQGDDMAVTSSSVNKENSSQSSSRKSSPKSPSSPSTSPRAGTPTSTPEGDVAFDQGDTTTGTTSKSSRSSSRKSSPNKASGSESANPPSPSVNGRNDDRDAGDGAAPTLGMTDYMDALTGRTGSTTPRPSRSPQAPPSHPASPPRSPSADQPSPSPPQHPTVPVLPITPSHTSHYHGERSSRSERSSPVHYHSERSSRSERSPVHYQPRPSPPGHPAVPVLPITPSHTSHYHGESSSRSERSSPVHYHSASLSQSERSPVHYHGEGPSSRSQRGDPVHYHTVSRQSGRSKSSSATLGLHAHFVTGHFHHEHSQDGRPPISRPPPSASGPTQSPTILLNSPLNGYSISEANLGPGILGAILRSLSASEIGPVVSLAGFPVGTVLSYMDEFGNNVEVVGGGNGIDLLVSAPNLGALFSILESLMVVTSPGDQDYMLEIEVESASNPGAMQTISVPVIVTPMATIPVVDAPDSLSVDGNGEVVVPIRLLAPGSDDSEMLALRLEVARDGNGILLGVLDQAPGVSAPGVSFTALGNGVYTLSSSLNSAGLREAAMNLFLLNGLIFRSTGQTQGLFPQGISLTATVTETAGGSNVQATTQDFISLNLGAAVGPTVPTPPVPAPVPTPSNSNILACYNAGGTDFTDMAGQIWESDSNIVVNNMGIIFSDTSVDIAGTVDDGLYQTQRFGVFQYEIPIPNGTYQVVLHFSEIFFGVAQNGHREFDVSIEGSLRYNNVNIAELGGNMPLEVVTLVSQETVSDGSLSISFGLGGADQPFISGIKILTTNMVSPTPQPFKSPTVPPTSNPSDKPTDAPVTSPPSSSPTKAPTAVPSMAPTSDPIVACYNGGGTAFTDSLGRVWQSDGTIVVGNMGAVYNDLTVDIEGTADDGLYQTYRFGVFQYEIPIPNGTYQVDLHFAEIFWGVMKAGEREFDVRIENLLLYDNLNVVEQVGDDSELFVLSSDVAVADGFLSISFELSGEACCDVPFISALKILDKIENSNPNPSPVVTPLPPAPTPSAPVAAPTTQPMLIPSPTPSPVSTPTGPAPPTPSQQPANIPGPQSPTGSPVSSPTAPVAAPTPTGPTPSTPTDSPVSAPVPAPTSMPMSSPAPVCGTVYVTNNAPLQGTCQTPLWVGVHDGTFDLYDRGEPISSVLEALAEDGNNDPLIGAFGNAPGGVFDGVVGASPICPGETAELPFDFDLQGGVPHYLSYASMVLPSNDAFVANGNPLEHPIFNANGVFQDVNFCVEGSEVLDAGSEVNDEIPINTAFFGQSTPDTGADQGGVINLHPGFLPGGSGGILDSGMFSSGDFTVAGYKMLTICVALKGDEDSCVVATGPTPLPSSPPNPTDTPASAPTNDPTKSPTFVAPTGGPVRAPQNSPTEHPTSVPTSTPISSPTDGPTPKPLSLPTDHPTRVPTGTPVSSPTDSPTKTPSSIPTDHPTRVPTGTPVSSPTDSPTKTPPSLPTDHPTRVPTDTPVSSPTDSPTKTPPSIPTDHPTRVPTGSPVSSPTDSPTKTPPSLPTDHPTRVPSDSPVAPAGACGSLVNCQLVDLTTLFEIGNLTGTDTVEYLVAPSGTGSFSIACFVGGAPDLITSTYGSGEVSTVAVSSPNQFFWLGGVLMDFPVAIDYLSSVGSKTISVSLTQNGVVCANFQQDLLASASPSLAPGGSPTSSPTRSPSTSGPVAIAAFNSGGTAFTDSQGTVWLSDESILGTGSAGLIYSDSSVDIAGTIDDELYQHHRFGIFQYEIPVPNGDYQVDLHFSEIFWGVLGTGEREFDVSIENVLRYDNLNVVESGGGSLEVVVLSTTVTVMDGSLSISFQDSGEACCDVPFVAGVQVFSVDATAPVFSPTNAPVASPSDNPTKAPQSSPTGSPVVSPTDSPVASPTASPVVSPTDSPVASPTDSPVASPTASPVAPPTASPVVSPTDSPVASPTDSPVASPTASPVAPPTASPVASPTESPVASPSGPGAVAAFNSGGSVFTDSQGTVWLSDQNIIVAGSEGLLYSDTAVDIAGTVDDEIYQFHRFGVFQYEIPVPNGNYQVDLHFSEIFWDVIAAGEREFDVSIENVLLFDNLNVAELGGGALEVVVLSSTVSVTDGSLSISFQESGEICCDTPFVSGVQIFTAGSMPSPPSEVPSAAPSTCGFLLNCQLTNLSPLSILGDVNGMGTLNYMVDPAGTSRYSIACFVGGNPDLITSTYGSGEVSTVVVENPGQFFFLGGVDSLTLPIPIDYLSSPGSKTVDIVLTQNGEVCDSLSQALLATT